MDKKYEELKFTDDFMFCKILYTNPDLCRQLLELILGRKVRKINYLTTQNNIDITSDGKGIRLDVYLEGDNKIYDIEMQTTGNSNLPKRTRYYQGMIDLNLIEKGADYNELKETFIIFVCLHDPFKLNECVYTFENRCKEIPGLSLGDESTKIFLNASGNKDKLSEQLKNFIDYLSGNEPKGNLARAIAEKVEQAVQHEEWRTEYMTLLQRDREKIAEGKKEGKMEERFETILYLFNIGIPENKILQRYTKEEVDEVKKQLSL